jgi:hypothetical protein
MNFLKMVFRPIDSRLGVVHILRQTGIRLLFMSMITCTFIFLAAVLTLFDEWQHWVMGR